jgi:hypothetical protein
MTTEVRWSEFERNPKRVAALADEGDVRIDRGDDAALLLVTEDRASSSTEGAVTAARVLRALARHLPAEVRLDEFGWMDHLPEDEYARFVMEFAHTFQASAELGSWSILNRLVLEWRSRTARIPPSLSKHPNDEP